MAIIGRISQGDSLQQMEIKTEGQMIIPKLARRVSLLDNDWTEQIVIDALAEIFSVFRKVVKEHAAIDEKRDRLLIHRKIFSGKSNKKKLEWLHKILNGIDVEEEK